MTTITATWRNRLDIKEQAEAIEYISRILNDPGIIHTEINHINYESIDHFIDDVESFCSIWEIPFNREIFTTTLNAYLIYGYGNEFWISSDVCN